MEGLPAHLSQCYPPDIIFYRFDSFFRITINSVPDNRISYGIQMHPDLMRPACFNPDRKECGDIVAFLYPPAGQRFFASSAVSGHLLPVHRVSPYGQIDCPLFFLYIAMHKNPV